MKKLLALLLIFTAIGTAFYYETRPVSAELVNQRTYTSSVVDNGDGTRTVSMSTGHKYYKDAFGDFQPIDLTYEDMGTNWQMTHASYRLYVAKDFGANQLIRFDNRFEAANHTIYYEPKYLAWVNNPDLSDMVIFRTAQSVSGTVNGRTIRYTDAFGSGLHFEITLNGTGFTKEIVIDALTDLENPPTPDHKLVALFRYQGTALSVKKSTEEVWNEDGYFEADDGFAIEEVGGTKSFIKPAYIVDSSDPLTARGAERQLIKVFWKKYNNSLWQAKVLPKAFLQNATYPVRADTTTTFDINDGNDDGHEWETLSTDLTDGQAFFGGDGTYVLNGSFRFENITIPQGATIDSATFYATTTGGSQVGSPTITINAYDADDVSPSAVFPVAGGLSPTTASVSWSSISSSLNTLLTSPEIKTVIQEVIDRTGWASGNAINIWLNGPSTASAFRRVYTFNSDPGQDANLKITYTVPSTGGGTRTQYQNIKWGNVDLSRIFTSGQLSLLDRY